MSVRWTSRGLLAHYSCLPSDRWCLIFQRRHALNADSWAPYVLQGVIAFMCDDGGATWKATLAAARHSCIEDSQTVHFSSSPINFSPCRHWLKTAGNQNRFESSVYSYVFLSSFRVFLNASGSVCVTLLSRRSVSAARKRSTGVKAAAEIIKRPMKHRSQHTQIAFLRPHDSLAYPHANHLGVTCHNMRKKMMNAPVSPNASARVGIMGKNRICKWEVAVPLKIPLWAFFSFFTASLV